MRWSGLGVLAPISIFMLLLGCRDDGRGDGVDRPDGGPDVVEVTVCEDTLRAPDSGAPCQVLPGTGDSTLIRGDVLARDTVYQHGSVLITGDQITCVGCDCSGVPGANDATRIECANSAISPGLINPHDHLTFTEGAPIQTGATRYNHRHDWRGSLSTPQNPHGTGGSAAGMRWGELRMMFGGATSLVGSGAADGLIRNIDRLSDAEEARGFRETEFETFSLGDANETFRDNCGWNFTFEEDEVGGLPSFLPHVAEGVDDYAVAEFFCQSRSTDGARDFTERNTAHIHSIGLFAEDYFRMASDGAQIIWSPRSNISLYGMTASVTVFDTLGGVLALGTDWTYSGSANMLRELACADQLNSEYYDRHFNDKEIHDMATINAAIATGNDDLIGSLESGKVADVAIFQGQPEQFHRAVLEANNETVLLVVKDGLPLYGQTALVQAFGETCDPVDVCGEMRQVCTSREFGRTFDQIEDEVKEPASDAAYSAIFCDPIPAGEPTCVPSRVGEYAGTFQNNDSDGDGVNNAIDNCQFVFNPPRPIDMGSQEDADDDDIGDACDPEPLVADLDGDGVGNQEDNCPFEPNDNQADGDSDDKGDACDVCPALANPDTACTSSVPPITVTIDQIQDGSIEAGTTVMVTSVVVTGVSGRLVHVQDPGIASGQFAAIQVFNNTAPAVSVGDRVDVTGEVSEFAGNTQIGSGVTIAQGSATPIVPIDVSITQAVSGPFEHVLVRISSGTLDNPYDCTQDDAGCPDTGLFAYEDGGDTIVVSDILYEDAEFATHIGELPAVGCTATRFGSVRLYPRTQADFGN